MTTYEFSAELRRFSGTSGAWYFLELPVDAADEIRATTKRRGFGSVRVRAAINRSIWDTSVFPDAKSGSFLLPVRAAIRRAEDIEDGDVVNVSVSTGDRDPRPRRA